MKIKPVKGRPMLHWVGKRPIDTVSNYPAQLIDTYNVENPEKEPTYDKFKNGPNLLFHGDNKEILSTLLVQGFRGKIDLIYIDPPFASGADYVREVALRGEREKLDAEGHSISEQMQYTDIWANDTYLQFMYERLILMRELLADNGSIYVHCDQRMNSYLRLAMDEIFGRSFFVNEIIWKKIRSSKGQANGFGNVHDTIYFFSKNADYLHNKQYTSHDPKLLDSHYNLIDEKTGQRYQLADFTQKGAGKPRYFGDKGLMVPPPGKHWIWSQERINEALEKGLIVFTQSGKPRVKRFLDESKGKPVEDIWIDIFPINSQANESIGYPTQKPEKLLERIIEASSNENSIVLDCFVGSGTTAAVAEKLGRRWIAADINKGAIQTTIKRLQTLPETQHGIVHYRVNNYDASTHLERKDIVIKKYGVQSNRQEAFFDGTLDGTLVKIIDLTKPLTPLDIQTIKDELENRPEESRNITVFCYGINSSIQAELKEENRRRAINKIFVRDIGSEGITTFEPAEVDVKFEKEGLNVTITITDYISPTILARMDIDRTIFDEQIDDFRAQIDCVLIDTDYTGEHFTITESDLPEKKTDFVDGKYTVSLPRPDARVAVKIIDMLGEETVVTDVGTMKS